MHQKEKNRFVELNYIYRNSKVMRGEPVRTGFMQVNFVVFRLFSTFAKVSPTLAVYIVNGYKQQINMFARFKNILYIQILHICIILYLNACHIVKY